MTTPVWLGQNLDEYEQLQPRKYGCPQCYAEIYTGQTLCLSCGYMVQYGAVPMEVDIEDANSRFTQAEDASELLTLQSRLAN